MRRRDRYDSASWPAFRRVTIGGGSCGVEGYQFASRNGPVGGDIKSELHLDCDADGIVWHEGDPKDLRHTAPRRLAAVWHPAGGSSILPKPCRGEGASCALTGLDGNHSAQPKPGPCLGSGSIAPLGGGMATSAWPWKCQIIRGWFARR